MSPIVGFYTARQLKNSQIMRTKRILKCMRRNNCEYNFFVQLQKENYSLVCHSETHANLLWSCLKPPADFAERDKKLYWRLDCRSDQWHAYPLFVASCMWFIFFMSDEHAAVIYQRVASRSWRNNNCSLFIRHKDEYLSRSRYSCISWSRYSWLDRVSCIFMCFSIIFQTNFCGFFVCFPGEIALSSILRSKTIFFGCYSILREKISASLQFSTGQIWRAW